MENQDGSANRGLYVLVDGENIDWVLGSILKRPPGPEDRPRWQKVFEFCENIWGGRNAKPLFYINVSTRIPWPFISALRQMHFHPVLLSGDEDQKVVDIGIQKTMKALVGREDDVLLMSHDKDFAEGIQELAQGERKVGVLGFEEYLASDYLSIDGLEIFDLEQDASGFPNNPLERLAPIAIDSFNPDALLDRVDALAQRLTA